MAYSSGHERNIGNGGIFSWWMYGRGRKSGLYVRLSLRVVALPDGQTGIAIDQYGSIIPEEIELDTVNPDHDDVLHHGQQVWVTGGNGLYLRFEGDYYPLVNPLRWAEDDEGLIVYFGFLPFGPPKSDGAIHYSDDIFLEDAVGGCS